MSEDSIQRPKGRHSASTYEPEPEQKKPLFAKKEKPEAPAEEPKERKPLFGKKERPEPQDPEPEPKERKPLFGKKEKPEACEPEPFAAPEPASRDPADESQAQTVASINLAGAATAAQAPPEPADIASDEPEETPAEKRGIFQRKEEDRKGTWGDRGYSASDAEAHRDVRYSIPSFLGQTLTMFMVQMKLYSKAKGAYIMLFLAILIPILVTFLPQDFIAMIQQMCGSSNAYTGQLLAMMPLLLALFTAIVCGPSIGREFKDRTAYMNVSLPASRVSFYLGKYLAGFVICLGIFTLAYGVAIMMAMEVYDTMFEGLITQSILAMVASLFAFTATAFCIGSFSRKPSTMTPFMVMAILLPGLFLVLDVKYDIPELMLMPVFLPDVALSLLGTPMIGSVGGFLTMTGFFAMDTGSADTMLAVGVVWGLAFLVLGLVRTLRREM